MSNTDPAVNGVTNADFDGREIPIDEAPVISAVSENSIVPTDVVGVDEHDVGSDQTAITESELVESDSKPRSPEEEKIDCLIKEISRYEAVTDSNQQIRHRFLETLNVKELETIAQQYRMEYGGSASFAEHMVYVSEMMEGQLNTKEMVEKLKMADQKRAEWAVYAAQISKVLGRDTTLSALKDKDYHEQLRAAISNYESIYAYAKRMGSNLNILLDYVDSEGNRTKLPILETGNYSVKQICLMMEIIMRAARPAMLEHSIALSNMEVLRQHNEDLGAQLLALQRTLNETNSAIAAERSRVAKLFTGNGQFIVHMKGRGFLWYPHKEKTLYLSRLQTTHIQKDAIKFLSAEKARLFIDKLYANGVHPKPVKVPGKKEATVIDDDTYTIYELGCMVDA